MRNLIPPVLVLPSLLALAACSTGTRTDLRNTVVLHYQHVANVHRINFSTPVAIPRHPEPVQFVLPLESDGFWAVFVLCSLDATGAGAQHPVRQRHGDAPIMDASPVWQDDRWMRP